MLKLLFNTAMRLYTKTKLFSNMGTFRFLDMILVVGVLDVKEMMSKLFQ